MNRLLFLALASVLLMLSCGGKKETAPAEETPVDTMPQTIQDTVAEDTLEQLIAQTPLEKRDGSRLLVMDPATGETAVFFGLSQLYSPWFFWYSACLR